MGKVIYIVGYLLLALTSLNSWAALTCTPGKGIPRVDTVQLNPPTISAGADMPIGTVIYQGRWLAGDKDIATRCETPRADTLWYNLLVTLRNAPMPLSAWSDGPFGGGIYQTNIPGVGVAISVGSPNVRVVTVGSPVYGYTTDPSYIFTGAGALILSMSNSTLYISLIKTGQINPGDYTLNASRLPSFGIDIVNPRSHAAVAGLPIQINSIRLQGQLTVSTQTCTTPDVSVQLGTYEKSLHFKGINSTTPWIDSSISLTNCPTFHGFYNQDNSALLFDYNAGGAVSVGASINNSIGVRLTPTTKVINAANGIMAIDSTVAGAASGVGIQLGWGESSQTPTLFNFAAEQSVTLPKDGSPTIRVPLVARYIQTAANPTPGKANGKVTLTINYY
ncbi:MAG: fimbrial protein [Serratia sp. (in: enterobacteria)]|uniref:fimbrial protein n=1 Tax=Serratia sp. (in: enterobacteria) TaxID=616 RepID=UPI003F399C20